MPFGVASALPRDPVAHHPNWLRLPVSSALSTSTLSSNRETSTETQPDTRILKLQRYFVLYFKPCVSLCFHCRSVSRVRHLLPMSPVARPNTRPRGPKVAGCANVPRRQIQSINISKLEVGRKPKKHHILHTFDISCRLDVDGGLWSVHPVTASGKVFWGNEVIASSVIIVSPPAPSSNERESFPLKRSPSSYMPVELSSSLHSTLCFKTL